MKPGRELDALVAEKVMGCTLVRRENIPHCGCQDQAHEFMDNEYPDELKRYSTDISAAWEVVEKLTNEDFSLAIERYHESYCEVFLSRKGPYELRSPEIISGETAPHAICLAALKAVGVDV